ARGAGETPHTERERIYRGVAFQNPESAQVTAHPGGIVRVVQRRSWLFHHQIILERPGRNTDTNCLKLAGRAVPTCRSISAQSSSPCPRPVQPTRRANAALGLSLAL